MAFEDLRARGAWKGALISAALNTIGTPLELLIARTVPAVPSWPQILSVGVSALLLVVLCVLHRNPTTRACSLIFVANNAFIAIALWVSSGYYAASGLPWTPFEANKLGALAVSLLTPELWAGLFSIAAFAGSAVLKYCVLDPSVRAHLPLAEPWASAAFGLFAIGLLVYRTRRLASEREVVRAQTERVGLDRLARTFVAIRDLTNTPLQTIEFAMAVLRARAPSQVSTVELVDRAVQRLNRLNEFLDEFQSRIPWDVGEESFDSTASLEKHSSGARSKS